MDSLRLTIFDAARRAEWQEALIRFAPNDDVYFSPGYHAASAGPGGGEPFCALVEEGAHALLLPYLRCPIPGTPGLFDIQSAYGYGGPLVGDSDTTFLAAAWKALFDLWRSESIVAAFLRCHPLVENHRFLTPAWQVSMDRQTIAIDLRNGVEAAFAGPSAAKHRRDAARALRLGFVATELPDVPGALDEFLTLYADTMVRRGAGEFYFFPPSYYHKLSAELGARLSMFKVGHHETGEVAAMGLAFFGPRWAHYHLSASRLLPGGVNGTHLLLQAMAEAAARRGCTMLHLGGGRTAAEDDALFRFKRWVGRHELSFHTAGKIIDGNAYAELVGDWTARHGGAAPKWFLGYRQPAPAAPVSADAAP